jgi:hypothetical protein
MPGQSWRMWPAKLNRKGKKYEVCCRQVHLKRNEELCTISGEAFRSSFISFFISYETGPTGGRSGLSLQFHFIFHFTRNGTKGLKKMPFSFQFHFKFHFTWNGSRGGRSCFHFNFISSFISPETRQRGWRRSRFHSSFNFQPLRERSVQVQICREIRDPARKKSSSVPAWN